MSPQNNTKFCQQQTGLELSRCLVKSIRFCRHQIHLEWFLRVITNTWFCHLEQVCKCSDVSCFCRHKYIRKNVLTSSRKTPSSVATNKPANVLMSHPQHLFFCHRRRWRCPDIPSKTTGSVCNRSMRTHVDITSKPSGFVSSGSWLESLLIYMPRKRDVTRIL